MKKLFSVMIALGVFALVASVTGAAAAKPDYPSWSVQINTLKRFSVLAAFADAAVLDNETGLVWERVPSASVVTWLNAQSRCNTLSVGNRLGWRLPTIQELASLVDPSVLSPGPSLPPGHPFTLTKAQTLLLYWSATTLASNTALAWFVEFSAATVDGGYLKSSEAYVWCVRGGQGVDPQ